MQGGFEEHLGSNQGTFGEHAGLTKANLS
jgi:hypothetical protein